MLFSLWYPLFPPIAFPALRLFLLFFQKKNPPRRAKKARTATTTPTTVPVGKLELDLVEAALLTGAFDGTELTEDDAEIRDEVLARVVGAGTGMTTGAEVLATTTGAVGGIVAIGTTG